MFDRLRFGPQDEEDMEDFHDYDDEELRLFAAVSCLLGV